MAAKIFRSSIAHSTFIDKKGVAHKFGGDGKLETDDLALIAEIEAAAKSGAYFVEVTPEQPEAVAELPQMPASEAAPPVAETVAKIAALKGAKQAA